MGLPQKRPRSRFYVERENHMGSWTQIRVACKAENIDTVASVMSMLDNGLLIEDANEIDQMNTCYGELIDEKMKNADRSHGAVSIYLPEDKNPADYVSFIKERLGSVGIGYEISLSGMKEEDWANSWKKYFKPVRIGKRLVVVPTWETYEPSPEDVILELDPGMAFGTGTHETTRLCAMLIEDHMKPGARVLDVGTGSGILAIAAAKLGAESVSAYDIDPVAVRVARENCNANHCSNVMCGVSDLLAGVKKPENGFDFVCANIVADIIVRMSGDIAKYMREGALLAVSGIIDTQADRVRSALEAGGLTHVKTSAENDWNAMLFTKLFVAK